MFTDMAELKFISIATIQLVVKLAVMDRIRVNK